MAFPDDILLPVNAKSFGFVDTKYQYNTHWDITWSFSFALTGTEHGFVTFLTTNPNLSTKYAGQYLGYAGYNPYNSILTDPEGYYLLDDESSYIYFDDTTTYSLSSFTNGVLAIAFDSTGLFALPYINNDGVDISEIKKNSLIIRDYTSNILLNESLSSLSTEFFLSSSTKNYQTLRFRFSNSGQKLSIDYKNISNEYKNLTSIPINFNINQFEKVYLGFCFCSPISSLNTPSTLFLKNFHSQGNTEDPTIETLSSYPLSVLLPTTYTTISGVSAFPPIFE